MTTFQDIYTNLIKKLEEGLPEWLSYHNVHHTNYVIQQASHIAEMENICGRDLFLIKVAALYHDAGFLVQREEHEKLGCELAARDLKDSALNQAEIQKVCEMIMATKIPQTPKNILEQIIADADLEYLGTNHFKKYGQKLYTELRNDNPDLTEKEWDEIQVRFLSKHSYHTQYCKTYKEPVKQKNLEMVKEKLLAYPR